MTALGVRLCLVSVFAVSACTFACTHAEPPPKSPDDEVAEIVKTWPDDPKALIDHMNGWNRADLRAYERPDLSWDKFLCAATGETGQWIELHKQKLDRMGVQVIWNDALCRYVSAF